jgi:hypothetical protein
LYHLSIKDIQNIQNIQNQHTEIVEESHLIFKMPKSVSSVDQGPMATTKESVTHDAGYPADVAALMNEFTGAKYNKLMRKLDLHLIPIVSVSNWSIHCHIKTHHVSDRNPVPSSLP